MSSRTLNLKYTVGFKWVEQSVVVIPNGASTPTLGEGDPNGTYWSVAHTSTGIITLTSKDKFLACVKCIPKIVLAVPSGGVWDVMPTVSQNSNNTFNVALNLYSSGSLTDIAAAAGNYIYVDCTFRNSISTP